MKTATHTTLAEMALLRVVPACLALVLLLASPVRAAVVVTMDRETLDDLLSAVAVYEVTVPLAQGASLTALLDRARVLEFEPAGDGGGQDRIRTSVRLRAPQLGLTLNVEPRLSLHVVELNDESPGMLPPLRYPAQNLFLLAGAQGEVEVRSRVIGVEMERERLHFRISLEVQPPQAEPGDR